MELIDTQKKKSIDNSVLNRNVLLENLLSDITNNCPIYQQINIQPNISDFPIVDKKFISMSLNNGLLNHKMGMARTQLVIKNTSGSCGYPLKIYWNYNDYYKSIASIWRKRYKYYHILPIQLCLEFRLLNNKSIPTICEPNKLIANSMFVLNDNLFTEIINTILEKKPIWMYVLPHIFRYFCKLLDDYHLELPTCIRYVEFYGEYISNHEKEYYRLKYNNTIFASMYGAEEVNTIAYECPFHKMHILQNNVYAEVLCSNGGLDKIGKGKIVVTSLHNHFLPFIRYNLNDSVEIVKGNDCPCGEVSPLDVMVFGREKEVIHLRNGIVISPEILNGVVMEYNCHNHMPIIYYYFEFYQERNELVLFLKLNCPINKREVIKREMEGCIKKLLTGCSVSVEFTDEKIALEKQEFIRFQKK